MAFRSFRLKVLLLTSLLVAWSMGIAWCWAVAGLWLTGLLFFFLLIATVWSLLRIFENNRKDWGRLLTILRGGEFNQKLKSQFSENSLDSFAEEGNQVIDAFAQLKGKESGEYWLLRHGLQALQAGVVITDGERRIRWMNPAASELLEMPQLRTLSDHELLVQHLPKDSQEWEQVVEWDRQGWKTKWWIRWEMVKVSGEPLGLLLFQEVEQILETESIENWKRMIRILTHEITNSLQPMLSLSSYLEEWVETNGQSATDKEEAIQAVAAIRRRGQGLMRFVKSYRDFARLNQPLMREFAVRELYQRLEELLKPELEQENIILTWQARPGCRLVGDFEMLEQALINLVKNSREALKEAQSEEPRIELSAFLEREKVVFLVQDNGPGIKSEIEEDLFTPFFTTKREGSGIGLSMVKQLVNTNGGKIAWLKSDQPGTTFRMEFPMA
ncbi:PAS domain-containing sensor histidine kinase [bacterium SCSIO 12741]|nr:PAS domain-containing sensor histidine kinase [bacterium SCSIO 12741]